MNINDTSSSKFYEDFDRIVCEIMKPVQDQMIESVDTGLDLSHDNVIAQLLIHTLGEHGYPEGSFNGKTKVRLVEMADWMGPDWAQALYRASVFITKVA